MASIGGLILDIEEMLYGMAKVERPAEDTLDGGITDSDTSVTFANTTSKFWARGDYAELITADGTPDELVILAGDASSGTATIRRAQRQTTAAAQSDGDVVRKNPLYPRVMLERFIREVVRIDLHSPHCYYHSNRSLTWSDGDYTYNLDDNDYDVFEVYQFNISNDNITHLFPRGWWDVHPVADTTVASTGSALTLRRVVDTTSTVYYTAKTNPHVDDIASWPDEIADMIPWAVTAKVLGGVRTPAWRYDPNRQALPEQSEGGTVRDWRFFRNEFELLRRRYVDSLRSRERHTQQPNFRRRGRNLRRLTG